MALDCQILTASKMGPPFFFCLPAKKLPKKLGSSFLRSTSRSLLLFNWAEVTLPGLPSGGGGLAAFIFSTTNAMACNKVMSAGNRRTLGGPN